MGIHLYKNNKRRCYSCKNILELNDKNFSKNKAACRGFRYECRNCGGHSVRTKILQEKGLMCEICGIKHINSAFFDIDHIVPRFRLDINDKGSLGYFNKVNYDTKNFQVLCPNCHREKTINDRNLSH